MHLEPRNPLHIKHWAATPHLSMDQALEICRREWGISASVRWVGHFKKPDGSPLVDTNLAYEVCYRGHMRGHGADWAEAVVSAGVKLPDWYSGPIPHVLSEANWSEANRRPYVSLSRVSDIPSGW